MKCVLFTEIQTYYKFALFKFLEFSYSKFDLFLYNMVQQCVVARAISSQFPIATARVRSHVKSRRICDGQDGTGVGIFEYLGVPCQFYRLLYIH
jgi:hypothetical protein